ncbi:hypothetical protein [Piscinibacter koreensis]|uniref:3-deoxy-D-arabino-heptulosonate 7-phosphate synthase n=1 Tax=Piscinibacter koreensis TaxID=2742824 RepID=A0A7Y6NQ68_9BURK|nr:hypothetical protein [Schlegelella koreensis]NUZ07333.1 hypothetical protein [Schlegelella koreensis]
MSAEALLLAALRRAPRRYALPALPASVEEAAAEGPASALAFSIEHAREALARGATPAAELGHAFTAALDALIRSALQPGTGDAAFQAAVLQVRAPEVGTHARLAARHERDRRAARAAVDALAHPGKLRALPSGTWRDGLAGLHALAARDDWPAVTRALDALHADATAVDATALERVRAHPAIARLVRAAELATTPAVRHYESLRGDGGPRAGSAGAASTGKQAKRRGAATEARTLAALAAVATRLDAADPVGPRHRAVGGLLVPKGYPGDPVRAKNEWDAALVREAATADHGELCLLVEAKASPEAAHADLPRLWRGLRRLAEARAGSVYRFPTRDGMVALDGDSLRRLQPPASALPPTVFYCCDAPADHPQRLDAASRGMLLSEPACLAFAARLLDGALASSDELTPVWRDLLQARRLVAVLHQHANARTVREAMLHPDDLLAASDAEGAG